MKNKIIWVKINNGNYYKVLTKLSDIGINIYDNKKEHDYLLIKTTYDDYEKMNKYLVSYQITLYAMTGIKKWEIYLKYF